MNIDTDYPVHEIKNEKEYDEIYKMIHPSGIHIRVPRRNSIKINLSDLIQNISFPNTTNEDIIDFFKAINSLLNLSNTGVYIDGVRTEKVIDGKCVYKGKRFDPSVSCKVYSASEIYPYSKFVQSKVVYYLQNLSQELKDNFDLDKLVMEAFRDAITGIVYFYSMKTTNEIMCPSDSPFLPFFNKLNDIFGREIIRITCPRKCVYQCGRMIEMSQCKDSKRYFIVIDQIIDTGEGTTSNVNMYVERIPKVRDACGGRRKYSLTRKNKKQNRKSRRNRN
jgi:hypothetical protein